jgi:3-oxoacyl-[acyl-carrier protein] reductase
MATEIILYNGQELLTLKELLRPGLKAVFVGVNPAPDSVKAGHYYQGKLGRRLWDRLQQFNILPALPLRAEDDAAFAEGYGFADIVRRPTKSAKDLTPQELRDGVDRLLNRLETLGDRPRIIFTFATARDYASGALQERGYETFTMSSAYDPLEVVAEKMKAIQIALGIESAREPKSPDGEATHKRFRRQGNFLMTEQTSQSTADLADKIALVTGASQGIGRACALTLAAQGATVALAARNEEKLRAVAEEIVATGGRAEVFVLDISNEASIKDTAKAVIAKLGRIDILVNNAGITRDMLLLRMKRADWDDVIATNLTGTFLLTQAVLSSMMKSRWGRIISISSVVGETGQAGQANYAASKAGLIGFTKSLAREMASRNVTANVVAPGMIETAMTAVLEEKQKAAMIQFIPLGRPGTDQDIANAVAFLASKKASYITGHTLDVNGGMHMG